MTELPEDDSLELVPDSQTGRVPLKKETMRIPLKLLPSTEAESGLSCSETIAAAQLASLGRKLPAVPSPKTSSGEESASKEIVPLRPPEKKS